MEPQTPVGVPKLGSVAAAVGRSTRLAWLSRIRASISVGDCCRPCYLRSSSGSTWTTRSGSGRNRPHGQHLPFGRHPGHGRLNSVTLLLIAFSDPMLLKYEHGEHCICAKPSRDWPQAAIPSGSASRRLRKRSPLRLPQMLPVNGASHYPHFRCLASLLYICIRDQTTGLADATCTPRSHGPLEFNSR